MNILVLEASTTSAKAMLYSSKHGIVRILDRAYDTKYQDTTIHDADFVFGQLVDLGKQICENQEVDIIVLSGTWHSVMLCDKGMSPVTPVFTWAYTGAQELCKNLRKDSEYTRNFYQKTGCMVNAIYPVYKLMYLKEQGYDLANYHILGQGTYHYYKLTGKLEVMDSMASGSGLFHIHELKYDSDLLKEVGIEEHQLPDIISYKAARPLNKEGARLLGLTEGIPVVPAGPDGGLNQIGAGALAKGVMTFSVGTSGALRLTASRPVISENLSTWCYRSPSSWLSGVATSGCCNCVDWYKSRLFPEQYSYSDIEKNLEKTTLKPPVFLPFLYGERCPGWNDERRASFHELRPEHTAIDIYQSVLEGTLYNLYQSYQELVKLNGLPKKIRLSGGILNSAYWTQMCADIFRMEMEVDETKQSSLMGGALLGMALLDKSFNLEEYQGMASRILTPDLDKGLIYQERYESYLKHYHQVL
ncbi:MAG: hypothetical protein K0S76_2677 [Herbinix sp.]|jgi:gluconokinase|nr:hypothetical protein [Herbinix sp.]